MGLMYHVTCKECHKEWEVQTGHGLGDGMRESIPLHFPAKYRSEVEQLIEKKPVPPYGFSYKVGACYTCGQLMSMPTIYNQGELFTIPCPTCGGNVEKTADKPEDLRCPICGGELEATVVAFTD